MKRNEDGTINFSNGINNLLQEQKAREHYRQLTPGQRRKLEKDKARNRRMIDLPPGLEGQVEELASMLSIPVSNLIAYLLERQLEEIDIEALKRLRLQSKSMRFDYLLPLTRK